MLGIIGGSGLYKLEGFTVQEEHHVTTPFNAATSIVFEGELKGQRVFFLSRHNIQHGLLPHEINYRANIFALKSLGVHTLVSVSAVGSLQEKYVPGDFVLIDQYLDLTKNRESSFFGDGLIAHVATADPTSNVLNQILFELAASSKALELKTGATYACVEGPRFGTRAESQMLRSFNADVVGMTNCPEAFLALEAQMSYATIGVVTDYDSWKEQESVNAAEALSLYQSKLGDIQNFISHIVGRLDNDRLEKDPNRLSLATAMLSNVEQLSAKNQRIHQVLSL